MSNDILLEIKKLRNALNVLGVDLQDALSKAAKKFNISEKNSEKM